MIRLLLCSAVLLAPLALAQPYKKPLKQAGDALDDAASRARKAAPSCRQAVYEPLDQLADRADALKKDARPGELMRLKADAAALASRAAWVGCPDPVVNFIHRAEDLLDEARYAVREDRRDDRRDDRRGRRDDDDDDDGRWNRAQLSALQVQPAGTFEGERAVQVSVPELRLHDMRGQEFYLGARFKSFQGNWSEWITTQKWSVPSDPFVWKNAFTHFFRYSSLAEQDFSNGRFVAQVSLFDGRGRELAFREVAFTVRVPQLPPAPPPVVVVQPPPPVVVARDCGTGPDVGCGLARDGRFPMDGPTFQGFLRSMQSTTSELSRAQTAQSLFANHYATAVQFGLILDLFNSELTRMQVAQYGAPRIVNPEHTLGYADKFNSNLNRTSYTQLMARQPPSGQQVVVQPRPPPPGAPAGYGPRDCGTGPGDPGCALQRNGRWAMDAPTWGGVYASLRATPNELTRQAMLRDALGSQALTAAQLGLLLDLFNNELTRLDVARLCAERVVNPSHAIGHSTKWRNGLLAQDYVQVMGRQR